MYINELEMDKVILDLRSYVLLKKTWERMEKPNLQWSLIQLLMDNQHKIITMGRLHGIVVDIEEVSIVAAFEVIEIVDDNNQYPTLLRIDWDFDMNVIINLKRRSMVFEKNGTRVLVPLDPSEGAWYTKPIHDKYGNEYIDNIYKLTLWDEDWINPTTNGRISWEKDSSRVPVSDEELENWKSWLHKVSTLRCNRLTKSLHCISIEVRNLPYYDGISDVNLFLDDF